MMYEMLWETAQVASNPTIPNRPRRAEGLQNEYLFFSRRPCSFTGVFVAAVKERARAKPFLLILQRQGQGQAELVSWRVSGLLEDGIKLGEAAPKL